MHQSTLPANVLPTGVTTMESRRTSHRLSRIRTHSFGTSSRNPDEPDIRSFDLASASSRESLMKFISWCTTNNHEIRIVPLR